MLLVEASSPLEVIPVNFEQKDGTGKGQDGKVQRVSINYVHGKDRDAPLAAQLTTEQNRPGTPEHHHDVDHLLVRLSAEQLAS